MAMRTARPQRLPVKVPVSLLRSHREKASEADPGARRGTTLWRESRDQKLSGPRVASTALLLKPRPRPCIEKNLWHQAFCNFCKTDVEGRPENMFGHIIHKCLKAPQAVRQEAEAQLAARAISVESAPVVNRKAAKRAAGQLHGGQSTRQQWPRV